MLRPRSRLRSDTVDPQAAGMLRMPTARSSPVRSLVMRLLIALFALAATALIVYLGREGYVDDNDAGEITPADALYYATVSLSTTGYGDIAPVSTAARAAVTAVITPLRVLFLIVLVGTTVELLTERSRQSFRIQRWRSHVRGHTIVAGYGTKGQATVETLLGEGVKPEEIVVVDTDRTRLDVASGRSLVTVSGNATRSAVLRIAGVQLATTLVVALDRDDTGSTRVRAVPPGRSRSWARSARPRTCTCCASPAPAR